MNQQHSLFERLGGMNAVNAAVDIFYSKVLSDPSINHFFSNTDMETQKAKQRTFLAYAFGAPLNYSGKNMRAAHAQMSLSENHFNAVATHLIATLKDLGVAQSLIDEVTKIALSTKNDVLGN